MKDDDKALIYSITLFTFVIIFIFCYIRHVFTFFERNRIAVASYPTFPFGNTYDVIFGEISMFMLIWKFYNKLKRKNFQSGGFYLFLKPAVLIIDPEITENKEFFRDDNSDFNDKLSEKVLGKIVENIQNVWNEISASFEKEELNFSQIMNSEFLETSFQKFFNVEGHQWPKDVELQGKIKIFRKLFSLSYPHLIKSKNYDEKEKETLMKIIQNRRKITSSAQTNIVQILLNDNHLDEEIADLIINIMHILKISNNLVLFTLYELMNNEEIQDELRGEILRFRKNKFSVKYSELNEMAYLETVVCETLRKYPVKPLIYKICTQNFEKDDVKLSKDLLVFVSIFGVHHDVQNYTNPELFDPDRFSEENEKYIDPKKYLPFGHISKDNCGQLYTKLFMKVTLLELLSRFKFSHGKKPTKAIQFEETLFDILKFKEDLCVKIHRIS